MTTMVVAMLGNYWWKFLGELCDDDADENDDNDADNDEDENLWESRVGKFESCLLGFLLFSLLPLSWCCQCRWWQYPYPDSDYSNVANVDDDNTFILVVVILMMPL